MRNFFSFKNILIVVLIAICMWQYRARTSIDGTDLIIDGVPYEVVRTIRDTMVVTVHQRVPVYIPTTQIVIDSISVPYQIPVTAEDSAKIVEDYLRTVIVHDTLTLVNDSIDIGSVVIRDVISANRLQSREWQSNFNITTVTETVIVRPIPRGMSHYVGGSVTTLGAFGPVYTTTRSNLMYSLGLYSSPTMGYSGSVSISLKLF